MYPIIRYEVQKHVDNEPGSEVVLIGFFDSKLVSKKEFQLLKKEGWFLVRKNFLLITPFLDWYKVQSDTIKIGLPSLILGFLYFIVPLLINTNKNRPIEGKSPLSNDLLVTPPSFQDTITKAIETSDSSRFQESVLINNEQLPYLQNFPILDKGIFIKHYFSDLIIGGVNIDTLRINARARDSEVVEIEKSNKGIEIPIFSQPFIEFDYKGELYSLQVLGKNNTFYITLRENVEATMKLKRYE